MEFVPCLLYRQYDFLHGKSGFVSKKRDFVVITQQSPRFFCSKKGAESLETEKIRYGPGHPCPSATSTLTVRGID